MQKSTKLNVDKNTLRIVWRGLKYLRPYWKLTLGVYSGMLLINAINIASPQFIRWIVDSGIYGKDLTILSWAVVALLGITLVKGVLVYFQGSWTEAASQNVAYDLRNAIQHKLNSLAFAFHDPIEVGRKRPFHILTFTQLKVIFRYTCFSWFIPAK